VVFIFSACNCIVIFFYFYKRKCNELQLKVEDNKKRKRKRVRISKDLSGELSNSFNNIRIISKESNPSDIEKSEKDFMRVRQMCNKSIELLEDIIWVVSEENITTEDLIFKKEDYGDDILRSQSIPFEIKKIDLPLKKKMDMFLRRNLLFLF